MSKCLENGVQYMCRCGTFTRNKSGICDKCTSDNRACIYCGAKRVGVSDLCNECLAGSCCIICGGRLGSTPSEVTELGVVHSQCMSTLYISDKPADIYIHNKQDGRVSIFIGTINEATDKDFALSGVTTMGFSARSSLYDKIKASLTLRLFMGGNSSALNRLPGTTMSRVAADGGYMNHIIEVLSKLEGCQSLTVLAKEVSPGTATRLRLAMKESKALIRKYGNKNIAISSLRSTVDRHPRWSTATTTSGDSSYDM